MLKEIHFTREEKKKAKQAYKNEQKFNNSAFLKEKQQLQAELIDKKKKQTPGHYYQVTEEIRNVESVYEGKEMECKFSVLSTRSQYRLGATSMLILS